jgi:hypothetical protein
MADPVTIQGSSYVGKIRNPLGVVGLSLITLGIYSLVWYFKTNKELAELGQAKGTQELGTNPTTSVLAIIPGAFIIVPPFVSYYNYTKRLNAGERLVGIPEGMAAGLLFLLMIFISPIGQYIAQANLNKVLQAQEGGGALAAPAAQAAPAASTESATPAAPAEPTPPAS